MSRQPIHVDVVPYSSVPQTGAYSPRRQQQHESSSGSGTSSDEHLHHEHLHHGPSEGVTAIVTGEVGGAYGPYSYEGQGGSPGDARAERRQSYYRVPSAGPRSSTMSMPLSPTRYQQQQPPLPQNPFSPTASTSSSNVHAKSAHTTTKAGGFISPVPWSAKYEALDDELHALDDGKKVEFVFFSLRGWLNLGTLVLLLLGVIFLFAGFPIVQHYTTKPQSTYAAYGLGGINASGQVPLISVPSLLDAATPSSALSRTGFDGKNYVLVFSDEFEVDGRTFWPGDDPWWEAQDLHYWETGDYEWYDPDAVTTKDGKLVITITEQPNHGLNFRSGMLQSWNKFCYTGGGYIEVSVRLPGSSSISGLWPGAWTLGNLARAGYGATTDGTWPYSYNSCDVGTLPNQTNVAGTGPAAALTSGPGGGSLSYLPGQRLSACTCSGAGTEHPGPSPSVGRGAPEIDIFEAQVAVNARGTGIGGSSQSAQFAPFDAAYEFGNGSAAISVYTPSKTNLNSYKGGVFQQACSAVTTNDQTAYEKSGGLFSTYGFESYPDPTNGYITWAIGGQATWTLNSAAVGPNSQTQIGQRLVSQEPMSIILNLGFSSSFETIDWARLQFPATLEIDYVRVYQREGATNIGCDPPEMPTATYIQNHLNAYSNANLTSWQDAGYKFPKNSMQGC